MIAVDQDTGTAGGGPEGTGGAIDCLDLGGLDIVYGAGSRAAVSGVSLKVRAGEIVGVIGESGSGKSSVALAAMGLLPGNATVDAERLSVVGRDIRGLDEKQLCDIRGVKATMVFQEPMTALNPCTRVGEQIAEVLRIHGLSTAAEARRRAVELLHTVRMPEPELRARQFPHQLSGGQRQRVMIAMAVAASPNLLVADEPTTALDVTVQAQILELIVELKDRLGMGVLFISHDLGVISQICDRVVVMYGGEIMEEGATREVLDHPRHPYTLALLRSVPRLSHAPRTPLAVIEGTFSKGDRLEPGDDAGGVVSPEPSAVVEAGAAHPGSAQDEPGPAGAGREAEGDPEARPVLLEFRDVVQTFKLSQTKKVRAVDGVSFEIRRGETFGIVGESGSGKSTLARMATLLRSPDSGHLLFEGRDVTSRRSKAAHEYRRRIQMVFQDPNGSLDPRYPILRTVAEPLGRSTMNREEKRALVERTLASVGFGPDALARLPHEFSGGQRQRIAIARALVTDPDFIVLDEPTSALDVSIQAQILNLLLDIQQRTGVTYMFISHNLGVVRHLAHRMAVMERGRIVETGDSEDVFANPQHEYTQKLLAALPEA